jgi:hypothetical protein
MYIFTEEELDNYLNEFLHNALKVKPENSNQIAQYIRTYLVTKKAESVSHMSFDKIRDMRDKLESDIKALIETFYEETKVEVEGTFTFDKDLIPPAKVTLKCKNPFK